MGLLKRKITDSNNAVVDLEDTKNVHVELLTERLFTSPPAKKNTAKRDALTIDIVPTLVSDVGEHVKGSGPAEGITVKPAATESTSTGTGAKKTVPKTQVDKDEVMPRSGAPMPAGAKPVGAQIPIDKSPQGQAQSSPEGNSPSARDPIRKQKIRTELCILTECGANEKIYWELLSDGFLRRTHKPSANCSLMSLSSLDVKLPTPTGVSTAAAHEEAAEVLYAPSAIVNLSETRNAVYATPASRLDEYSCKVLPGIALLEMSLEKMDFHHAKAFGWNLPGSAENSAILALYHKTVSGRLQGPSIYLNSDNLNEKLNRYREKVGLSANDKIILLGWNELDNILHTTKVAYQKRRKHSNIFKYVLWFSLLGLSLLFSLSAYHKVLRAEQTQKVLLNQTKIQSRATSTGGAYTKMR